MLKILKLKAKLIELSNERKEIEKYSLELYSILIGYFLNKKDSSFSFFNDDDVLKELEKRILDLAGIKYFKILGIKNNSKYSFNIFIENISKDDNKEICEILKKYFTLGYDYYDYYHNKYNSIFDYILTHKHERLEYKLKNFIK